MKGNKTWGKPMTPELLEAMRAPTQFEKLATELGVFTLEEQEKSPKLRKFAERYFRTRYVPEALLKAWGLHLDYDFDGGSWAI